MLVNTDEGDTYTRADCTTSLTAAGFARVDTTDIASHSPAIVAVKSVPSGRCRVPGEKDSRPASASRAGLERLFTGHQTLGTSQWHIAVPVRPEGLEPSTSDLRGPCSTN